MLKDEVLCMVLRVARELVSVGLVKYIHLCDRIFT